MISEYGQDAAAPTVLGLDLGTNSIGWCLLGDPSGCPQSLIDMGTRIFDAGMEGDISSGKGESRATSRRMARMQRRQTDRRARRRDKLLNLLQKHGLLACGKAKDVLPALDRELRQRHLNTSLGEAERSRLEHVLPYWLRARALEHRLETDELGRVFYHLAQRRGFLSNRKAPAGKKDEDSQIKQGIIELQQKIQQDGCRTLGEYFSKVNPLEQRIRSRWTSRAMYQHEFDCLWAAQARHHPGLLTDGLRKEVHRAIFKQRPLKSARHLIGKCMFEKRRRAPVALLEAQRFRLLQQVNNLRLITPDGEERALTSQERSTLVEVLDRNGDMSMAESMKALKLKRKSGKTSGHSFTIEEGGEKRLIGNRTNAKLAEVLGERWWGMSICKREMLIQELRSFEKMDALVRRLQKAYAMDEGLAAKVADIELEDGYVGLSRQAIQKILPELEAGTAYATAIQRVYGETSLHDEVQELLPPVHSVADVRNPVVNRVLTELRKVVNHVVRKHGKPGLIRIELARDLRSSRKQREQATRRNRDNETSRAKAAAWIAREAGIASPRPNDVLKVLLAEECNWCCPYTGRSINMGDLVGANPQFDIEHIIPFSRCLDDSFTNKTLCYHEENRHVKTNRTPFEVYGANADRWHEILERVRRFQGDAAREKLRRFQLELIDSIEDFTSTQLNDTRYASALASQYLATLYGGLWDESGTRRIQACKGGVTAYVRDAYQLNGILNDGGFKTRDDHRHHAVDALAIAMTAPQTVAMLSRAAFETWQRDGKRGRFQPLPEPWPHFLEEVSKAVSSIVPSFRPNHGINGRLHQDTYYGKIQTRNGNPSAPPQTVYCVRKPLVSLKPGDIKDIIDPAIRNLVRDALAATGLSPDKAFADEKKHPVIPPKRPGGRAVPIHRVRIACNVNPKSVGNNGCPRLVTTDTNHHLEIVAILDEQGNETKWEGVVVDRLEAMERHRRKEPIVKRDHGPNKKFKFSIASGDTIRTCSDKRGPEFLLVRSVSQRKDSRTVDIELCPLTDARKKDERIRVRKTSESLRAMNAAKVYVLPTGQTIVAND